MPILWDEQKRRRNVSKHGLNFALVEEEFDFKTALYTPAREGRMKAIGLFQGRVSVLIFQLLGEEAISLVSLRIASKKERMAYDRQV